MINLTHRFLDKDYDREIGLLEEERLLAVNHICLQNDCLVFNDLVLPFGMKEIEEKSTFIIDDILHEIIFLLQNPENINRKIIICGEGQAKRMLGRKLEDRLKREVNY